MVDDPSLTDTTGVSLAKARAVTVVIPVVVYFVTFFVTSLLEAPFFFAPDPHFFPSRGYRFEASILPFLAATALAILAMRTLERRHSSAGAGVATLWPTRLISVALIVGVCAASATIDMTRAVIQARSTSPIRFEATNELAQSVVGRRALAAITRDSSVPMGARLDAAKELGFAHSALQDVEALAVEASRDSDPAVRLRVVDVARQLPPDSARPILRRFIDDPDEKVTAHALESLSWASAVDASMLDRLELLMFGDNHRVRVAAYSAFIGTQDFASPRLAALLRRLLDGPDEDLRVIAAQELADRHDPSGFDAALAAIREGPRHQLGETDRFTKAMYALGRTQNEGGAPILWTLEHCEELTPGHRRAAGLGLTFLYMHPGVDARNERPPAYQPVDPVAARSQAAWRPEFCDANAIERARAQPPLPSVTGE